MKTDPEIPKVENAKKRLAGMYDHFGNKLISQISPWDIERYKSKRSGEAKPTTVNKCLQILSKMYNLAINWGYIDWNPVQKIKKYDETPFRRTRVLISEEERLLLDSILQDYLKSMLRIFLNTGLRRKELLLLTWQYVNFERRQIYIAETKTALETIELPEPEKDGGKSVLAALWERRTNRSVSAEKLPLQMLSNLLWAAFGVNREEGPQRGTTGRTAATASNSQEIDTNFLFVLATNLS